MSRKLIDQETHQDAGSVIIEVRSVGVDAASLDSFIDRNFALVDKIHAKERARAAALQIPFEEMADSRAQLFPEADVLKTNLELSGREGTHSASAYLMKFYDVKATGGCATMHTHPLGERFVEIYTSSNSHMTIKSENPIHISIIDPDDQKHIQQPDSRTVILPPNAIAVTRIPKNVSHQFAPVGKVLGFTIHPNELAELPVDSLATGVMAIQTAWFKNRKGTLNECLADTSLLLPSMEDNLKKLAYNSGAWIGKNAPALAPLAGLAADVSLTTLNTSAGILDTLFDKGLVGLAQSAYQKLFRNGAGK